MLSISSRQKAESTNAKIDPRASIFRRSLFAASAANAVVSQPSKQENLSFFAKLWRTIKSVAVMFWSLITTCSLTVYREWQNKSQLLDKSGASQRKSFNTAALINIKSESMQMETHQNKARKGSVRVDKSVTAALLPQNKQNRLDNTPLAAQKVKQYPPLLANDPAIKKLSF